jgi:hypothetical protein
MAHSFVDFSWPSIPLLLHNLPDNVMLTPLVVLDIRIVRVVRGRIMPNYNRNSIPGEGSVRTFDKFKKPLNAQLVSEIIRN